MPTPYIILGPSIDGPGAREGGLGPSIDGPREQRVN